MKQPFFSIVIPTKARPEMVKFCLYSISNQTFKDYEVIISDNDADNDCQKIVANYANAKFHYYHTPYNLGINENWEYAMQYPQGKYITYIQDKMFYYADSLEKIYNCICAENQPDTVGWQIDLCSLSSDSYTAQGSVVRKERSGQWRVRQSQDIIDEKLEFCFYGDELFSTPGPGSVMCGAVKRELLDRIKDKYGYYFPTSIPDFGAGFLNLTESKTNIELEDNLTVFRGVEQTTGWGCTKSYKFFKQNLKVAHWDDAVVPGYDATNVNMISGEYNYVTSIAESLKGKACNALNVLIAIGRHKEYYKFGDMPPIEVEKQFANKLASLTATDKAIYDQKVKEKNPLQNQVYQIWANKGKKYQEEYLQDFSKAIFWDWYYLDINIIRSFSKENMFFCCYGAGKLGQQMQKKLMDNGILIDAFLVSVKGKNLNQINGIPVYALDDYPYDIKNTSVILTLSKRFHQDIENLLHIAGCNSIYSGVCYEREGIYE